MCISVFSYKNETPCIIARCTPADKKLSPRVHTVVQPAAVANRSCEGYEFRASGESTDIGVTVSGSVSWDVAENLDWLYVDSAASFTGSGTVKLRATANSSINPRSGVIRLAGRDFQVSQRGRPFDVSCETTSFDTYSDAGYISIDTDGDIDWTIESDSDWVNFDDGSRFYDGYGSQDIIFYVDEYLGDGLARTATLTVGNEKIYITQSAYAVSISPTAAKVSGNAGAGEISVSASSEEVWHALVVLGAKDWIETVTFGPWDPVKKKGTINYTYKANDSGVARRCTISINGEQYDLEQAARVIVNIDATTVGHGTVDGAGAQSQGERVSLTAIPDAGYEFAYWIDPTGARKEQNPLTVTADVAKQVTAHFTPLTPEILSCTSGTNGVELVWTNLAWAAEYRIYRAPTSEIPSDPLMTIPSGGDCTWLDETGELEKPYWYWVEAVGAEDEDPTVTLSELPKGGRRVKAIVISPILYENLKGATHTNPSTYQEETTYVFTTPSGVDGYTFAGWSPASISETLTGPLTVTATWTPNNYTLMYNANGGSGTMSNTACTYDRNATIAANGFTRTGYEFLGWSTSATGDVEYLANASVFNLTPNQGAVIELFAVWEKEEPTSCAAPQVTPGDGAVFIDGSASVTLACETEGAIIYYSTNGATPKQTEANRYCGAFVITDTTTVKAVAVYLRADGVKLTSAYVTAVITKKTVTLADAVGAPGLTFTTGGDAAWKIVTDATAKVDGMCVQTGTIGDEQTTWIETTITGAGTFTFWWKSDCEDDPDGSTWDHLAYSIDGVEQGRIDGQTAWAQVSVALDEGTHTIRWTYVKEALDPAKGAVIDLDAANPSLTTAPTKVGLLYTLHEGTTLGGMRPGAAKVGDGASWTPAITVKGGKSGFYTIGVSK
ncbi:MAG: chitobiase/beta-hexosaminidase C-terminal domain-containing protein [Kiritimatiellia bacterium]